ncbi:hypothetical protein UPYG_G00220250 [Umbra pygmaea]|uniref:Uncharacterized protein n=1 Tax=Umbra pygmaea TaxID=75934 RepID=A0ABD0WD05_UMBPY
MTIADQTYTTVRRNFGPYHGRPLHGPLCAPFSPYLLVSHFPCSTRYPVSSRPHDSSPARRQAAGTAAPLQRRSQQQTASCH